MLATNIMDTAAGVAKTVDKDDLKACWAYFSRQYDSVVYALWISKFMRHLSLAQDNGHYRRMLWSCRVVMASTIALVVALPACLYFYNVRLFDEEERDTHWLIVVTVLATISIPITAYYMLKCGMLCYINSCFPKPGVLLRKDYDSLKHLRKSKEGYDNTVVTMLQYTRTVQMAHMERKIKEIKLVPGDIAIALMVAKYNKLLQLTNDQNQFVSLYAKLALDCFEKMFKQLGLIGLGPSSPAKDYPYDVKDHTGLKVVHKSCVDAMLYAQATYKAFLEAYKITGQDISKLQLQSGETVTIEDPQVDPEWFSWLLYNSSDIQLRDIIPPEIAPTLVATHRENAVKMLTNRLNQQVANSLRDVWVVNINQQLTLPKFVASYTAYAWILQMSTYMGSMSGETPTNDQHKLRIEIRNKMQTDTEYKSAFQNKIIKGVEALILYQQNVWKELTETSIGTQTEPDAAVRAPARLTLPPANKALPAQTSTTHRALGNTQMVPLEEEKARVVRSDYEALVKEVAVGAENALVYFTKIDVQRRLCLRSDDTYGPNNNEGEIDSTVPGARDQALHQHGYGLPRAISPATRQSADVSQHLKRSSSTLSTIGERSVPEGVGELEFERKKTMLSELLGTAAEKATARRSSIDAEEDHGGGAIDGASGDLIVSAPAAKPEQAAVEIEVHTLGKTSGGWLDWWWSKKTELPPESTATA